MAAVVVALLGGHEAAVVLVVVFIAARITEATPTLVVIRLLSLFGACCSPWETSIGAISINKDIIPAVIEAVGTNDEYRFLIVREAAQFCF
jgi:hypothetical protein